jgi:hypothetical protein
MLGAPFDHLVGAPTFLRARSRMISLPPACATLAAFASLIALEMLFPADDQTVEIAKAMVAEQGAPA